MRRSVYECDVANGCGQAKSEDDRAQTLSSACPVTSIRATTAAEGEAA